MRGARRYYIAIPPEHALAHTACILLSWPRHGRMMLIASIVERVHGEICRVTARCNKRATVYSSDRRRAAEFVTFTLKTLALRDDDQ